MTKERLTHSRMQSFKLCRKKHYYEYEVGIRKETDAKALRMGHAGHEGLDVLKKTNLITVAGKAVKDEYKNCPPEISQYDWEIEEQTVLTLLEMYNWYWHNWSLHKHEPFDVIVSEASFEFPLRNPKTGYAARSFGRAGKIDGIITKNGRKLVLEHKFLGEDISHGGSFFERLRLDQQCTNYVDAANNLFDDVDGVLYDLIRKPTIQPTAIPVLDEDGKKIVLDANGDRVYNKDGKTYRQSADKKLGYEIVTRDMTVEEWGLKLAVDIEKRPDFYFQRHEIARLESDIQEFREEVWQIQLDIRSHQRSGNWYKTVNKGSCTYCSFKSLCLNRSQIDKNTQPYEYPEGFVKLEDVHPELG